MKNFIITLLSTLALSLSAVAFAGGAVVEAPADEANPAAQVAPVEEVATEATECDADKGECAADDTAATDSPAQVMPTEETAATDSPAQVAPVEEAAAS